MNIVTFKKSVIAAFAVIIAGSVVLPTLVDPASAAGKRVGVRKNRQNANQSGRGNQVCTIEAQRRRNERGEVYTINVRVCK